jgi:hypothetical protein
MRELQKYRRRRSMMNVVNGVEFFDFGSEGIFVRLGHVALAEEIPMREMRRSGG